MRFILIDEILEMSPGKSITGRKYVAPEEDYFRDHFPGFPVVPGVLLTEMMAQTAGKCLDAESLERGRSMLGKIQSASFRKWVRPGATAIIRAEIKVSRPQYATATCTVEVENQPVASSDLFFTFVPPSQFPAEFRDPVLERYWQATGTRPATSSSESSPSP